MGILKYPRAILLFLLTEEIPEDNHGSYFSIMWNGIMWRLCERLPRGGKTFRYNCWLEWQVAFHQNLIESLLIITASLCSVLFFSCISHYSRHFSVRWLFNLLRSKDFIACWILSCFFTHFYWSLVWVFQFGDQYSTFGVLSHLKVV